VTGLLQDSCEVDSPLTPRRLVPVDLFAVLEVPSCPHHHRRHHHVGTADQEQTAWSKGSTQQFYSLFVGCKFLGMKNENEESRGR
jgi:hypothetical protein